MVVNHPRRRRIYAYLMVLGNAGIVSVIATFVVFDQARRFGLKAVRMLTFLSILVLVTFGGLLIFQGVSGLID